MSYDKKSKIKFTWNFAKILMFLWINSRFHHVVAGYLRIKLIFTFLAWKSDKSKSRNHLIIQCVKLLKKFDKKIRKNISFNPPVLLFVPETECKVLAFIPRWDLSFWWIRQIVSYQIGVIKYPRSAVLEIIRKRKTLFNIE